MAKKAKGSKRRTTRRRRPAAQKPTKLTRGHVTARDHKDLSTYELNCRISAINAEIEAHNQEVDRLTSTLSLLRRSIKVKREDVEALEGLVESRR